MLQRCLLVVVLLIEVCPSLSAQVKVGGRIYETNDSLIAGATVRNKNRMVSAYSDWEGRYQIFAEEADTLIFSAAGFIPDTVIVKFHMLLTLHDVTLNRKAELLEGVNVKSSYSKDSLERRLLYADAFKKRPAIKAPENGFGISFSPFSFFSKEAKQRRALKKRLLKWEKEAYVDRCFPTEWVASLTGLQGDSLGLFMFRYRPSYEFCRKTDRTGMILYVNEKLKEFKK